MNAVNSQLESASRSNSDAIVECVARTREASAFTVNAPNRSTATTWITAVKDLALDDEEEGAVSGSMSIRADSRSDSSRDEADDEVLISSEFRRRSRARSDAANIFLLGGRRRARSPLSNAGDIVVLQCEGSRRKEL